MITLLRTVRVRCDWESDNAACAIPIDISATSLAEVKDRLRYLGWKVTDDGHYCPDCKDSDRCV